MIKRLLNKLNRNHHSMDDSDDLYTSMIIALGAGILIVIATLIFLRPPGESFTELYFPDHKTLPEFVMPYKNHSYTIEIASHEMQNTTYKMRAVAEMFNRTITFYEGEFYVPTGEKRNLTINYSLPYFRKAKIKTEIINKRQDIHFFVYNEQIVMRYPDGLAITECLPEIKITPQDSFIIRAKGTLGPNLKVRIDGKEIFFAQVNNTIFQNFTINSRISPGTLDIIFDNDYSNKDTGEDRNLDIEYIKIGNLTLYPKDGIADLGKGKDAFDCENTRTISYGLPWNGALRYSLK